MDGNYKATVTVNGKEIAAREFNKSNILTRKEIVSAFSDFDEGKSNSMLIGKTEGPGRLYYDIIMDYFLTIDNIPPAEEGMSITREMTPLKEKEQGVHVNSTYKIKLTITVPEDRHFVAVESPLPAGFEAIDFSLNTSQGYLMGQTNFYGSWYFNHTEFRDDRVFLFADELPAGVYEYEYLARATTPGRFRYRPTKVWEMYYPEIFGQTEAGWLEIKDEE
jgi:hypothetical protein